MCSGNPIYIYVIGLHAVQFGNNWMKKIPRTAKIGRGRRPSPIWLSEEFFESNYFQIGQHVVLLLINYIASQLIQQKIFEVSPLRKPVKLQLSNFRW